MLTLSFRLKRQDCLENMMLLSTASGENLLVYISINDVMFFYVEFLIRNILWYTVNLLGNFRLSLLKIAFESFIMELLKLKHFLGVISTVPNNLDLSTWLANTWQLKLATHTFFLSFHFSTVINYFKLI